jgi:putative Mg2+ transporter-C (MgtC) family protein
MTFDYVLPLFAALACGVAIGLERQLRQRTAGLRTITLVTSGACLFVTLGALTGNGSAGITQIAAYVVSGVGFLGGGVIMRERGAIQGINTAATLWCAASVGVLCGSSHYGPAILGTAIILFTNTVLRSIGRAINTTPVATADLVRKYVLTVVCREEDEVDIRALITNAMASEPLSFHGLSSVELDDAPPRVEVVATIEGHPKYQSKVEKVASRLSMDKGVSSVSWIGNDVQPVAD